LERTTIMLPEDLEHRAGFARALGRDNRLRMVGFEDSPG